MATDSTDTQSHIGAAAPRDSGGPQRAPRPRPLHPGCPRCANARIWDGWATTDDRCSQCGLDFERPGWSGAMWINTWVTLIALIGWLALGFVATGSLEAPWITVGAIVLAVTVPVLFYPRAKMLLVRILLRLDPPADATDQERSGT